MNKIVYATPWYDCCLRCNHCEIVTRKAEYNSINFLATLLELEVDEDDIVVFFGGEPLVHMKDMWEILKTGKITCISTNLLLYEDGLGEVLKNADLSVATSWNPTRFTKEQYDKWIENVWKVRQAKVDTKVLITLTPDLFAMQMEDILSVFERIEGVGVEKFEFEPYIGSKEYHKEADDFLCRFHDAYKGKMENHTTRKLYDWNCNCSNVFTIYPSGEMKRGCPMYKGINIVEDCLQCGIAYMCRPCPLLKECSYPKKYAKKLGIIR